jgi:hypothetical protein
MIFSAASLCVNDLQSPTSDAALIDGHVYICTDANFDCTNYGFITNVCSNLPSEFQDYISSFGPDAGWACTFYMCVVLFFLLINHPRLTRCFYRDANCSGGIYVGTDIPGWLNDAFSSVRCVPGA